MWLLKIQVAIFRFVGMITGASGCTGECCHCGEEVDMENAVNHFEWCRKQLR